jgi:hypothetical protein
MDYPFIILIAFCIFTPIALLFIRLNGGWKNDPLPHPSPDKEPSSHRRGK